MGSSMEQGVGGLGSTPHPTKPISSSESLRQGQEGKPVGNEQKCRDAGIGVTES